MADLRKLNLTKIQNVVNCYRNLFYHRTVILEGIRKVAFRNMSHLSEAMDYCKSTGDTLHDHRWIDRIQQKMLADQQLENNELNRVLIGWATYYPVQVYLALLYAEVEFYQRFCNNSNVLADDIFSAYLDTRTNFTSKLLTFRHFFLHPSEDNTSSELDFLSVEGSYNLAPELQTHLDEYLVRTRLKVLGNLKSILFSLPENQRLYCTLQFLGMNFKRMEDFGDLEGMRHTVRQLRELEKQLGTISESMKSQPPSQKQMKMALTLAECLNEVSPSSPEQQHTELVPKQTPMTTLMLSLLVSEQAPRSYGNSRNAAHVTKNIGLLRRIIITAGVLLNEALTVQGRYSFDQIIDLGKKMSSEEIANSHFEAIRQNGLQHASEVASLYRVSTALLYEPLRLYAAAAKENCELSNQGLDRITAPNRMDNLNVYRNSVFHVFDPRKHSGKVDLAVVDPTLINEASASFGELAGFFGVRRPE